MPAITYTTDLTGVDWAALKTVLKHDDFDNGRTPEELRRSFENSFVCCLARAGDQLVGTARALSDGVCNAYIVDVWTLSAYRRQGIARAMLDTLLARLNGQHVYLFTDDAAEVYLRLGFEARGLGLERVVGQWLGRFPPRKP